MLETKFHTDTKQLADLWVLVGPNGDEIKGGWKKLHNVELHNLHSSTNY
jgi:hypothetical protein